MVCYYEGGCFCEKGEEWDQELVVFYLEYVVNLGELEVIVGLGFMYLQLFYYILVDVFLKEIEENKIKGFDYLLKVVEVGDRQFMILVV